MHAFHHVLALLQTAKDQAYLLRNCIEKHLFMTILNLFSVETFTSFLVKINTMSKTSYLCVVVLHFECPVCQPHLYCSAVFSAEFCSFRKNSANPNIGRKICSASRILKKMRLRGLRTLLVRGACIV